jgi:ferric-dicitrate binding protein FerR (iron transport regulator)
MDGRISFLVSKKLTGEISEGETLELNHLLSNSPELYETIQLLEFAWSQNNYFESGEASIESLIHKIEANTPEESGFTLSPAAFPEKRKKFSIWWAAAASAGILLFAAIIWKASSEKLPVEPLTSREKPVINEVQTKPGSQTNIVLHDGTKVWLNADSKLSYANDFNGQTREVNLIGEAFFDVVSNKTKPFIIHTSKIVIRVTGTSFNVRSYPDEARVETSLIKGKVEVSLLSNPDKIFYLNPSEKLVLNDRASEKSGRDEIKLLSGAVNVSPIIPEIRRIAYYSADSIPVETAWLNHQLAFYDESFREVANKMEKWYNVKIVFASPALENIRFTGKFENETIEQAFAALQIIGRFRFDINKQTIIISKSNN